MVLEIAAEGLIARAERCYSLKDFEHSRELLDEASLLAARRRRSVRTPFC